MARSRNSREAITAIFNVSSLSHHPPDSPHHYALGRHLELSGSVTAQLMSKHFMEDPRLIGEELPYGCRVMTPKHLRHRTVRNLSDW